MLTKRAFALKCVDKVHTQSAVQTGCALTLINSDVACLARYAWGTLTREVSDEILAKPVFAGDSGAIIDVSAAGLPAVPGGTHATEAVV
jgi:hypothetical protein